MKKITLLISAFLFIACEFQNPIIEVEVSNDSEIQVSENEEFVCGRDKVKDMDGNEYKTAYFDIDGGHDVTKEGQCWMAENLNVGKVILNPGDEPSDNGVIEKWCMTDDWSADFLLECEIIVGGGKHYSNCQKRNKHLNSRTIKSNSDYCTGENGYVKHGGLYTWEEAHKYNHENQQGICPKEWKIPKMDDWNKLEKFIQNGLSYEEFIRKNKEYRFIEGLKEGLPVGDILKKGIFDAKLEGIYNGVFSGKGNRTIFLSDDQGAIYLENHSHGNIGAEKEMQRSRTLKKRNFEFGYSVRCIKEGR